MNSAILVQQLSPSKALYGLKPALQNSDGRSVELVIVSAAHGETFIFEADLNGRVVNWDELDGSFVGAHDHAKALTNAGYDIVFS